MCWHGTPLAKPAPRACVTGISPGQGGGGGRGGRSSRGRGDSLWAVCVHVFANSVRYIFLPSSSTAKPRLRPILQKNLPKNTTAQIGDNATMTCIVLVSGTLPDFRWLKWDKSVTSTKKISYDLENGSYRLIDPDYYKTIQVKDHYGVELRITNITEDDFGLYTCFVSNHIGKDYNSAFLSKLAKPTAYVKGQ